MRNTSFSKGLVIGGVLGVALTVALGAGAMLLERRSDHQDAKMVIPNYGPKTGPLQLISLEDYDSTQQGPMRFRDETWNCLFYGEMVKTLAQDGQVIKIERVACPSANGGSYEDSIALAIPLENSTLPIRTGDKLNAYHLINTGLGAQMIDPLYFAGKTVEAINKCKKSDGTPCFVTPQKQQGDAHDEHQQ